MARTDSANRNRTREAVVTDAAPLAGQFVYLAAAGLHSRPAGGGELNSTGSI
jgi:hypothetical protein